MNKIKLSLVSLSTLLLPVLASAQVVDVHPTGIPGVSGGLPGVITSIENAAATVFGAIAVISFIIAGILFLTSQGAADKITAARQAFIWGIAGVVVGILAFSIIAIIGSFIH